MAKEIELQEMSRVEVLFNRISHLIEQSQIVATPLPQFTSRVGTHPAAKRQHICTAYQLYSPDKALLQQKLREWIAEFKDKEGDGEKKLLK